MENQERKKIRVRIVKSTSQKLWYRDRIGEEIEVFADSHTQDGRGLQGDWDGEWFELADRPQHFARVEDCEVIPEESKPTGPIGREEGDVCNRNGCPGKIVIVHDPERSCTCHINPPCSRCMDVDLKCDQCGAEPMEEEVREALAIPEEAPKMEPDETWPGFAGLQAYEQGDFPEGMIPFFMQGDLGKFEEMYFNAITLLSMDSRKVCTNLLFAIWHFGNDQWRQGCDYGRKNPAQEASPNDGQEMPPSPYNRLKQWADTGEKERIFSVMVAAAEYLKEEWEKLVDDAGCGPANLCHRLENCIDELYPGYTAGAFEAMEKQIEGLKAKLKDAEIKISERSKACKMYAASARQLRADLEDQTFRAERALKTLEESAARADGLQNELDGAREYAVALKEQVAIAQNEAQPAQDGEKLIRERLHAATLRFHMVNGADEFHAISKFMNDVSSILCGAMMTRKEWKNRAILEELVGKLSEESAKWEHRGRKAESDLGMREEEVKQLRTRLNAADSMLDVFRRKNLMLRRQVLQARDSFYESMESGPFYSERNFKSLWNAALDHVSVLDRIANLPSTEENLQPVNEAKGYATGGSLAPACSNDVPVRTTCQPCGEVADRIDRIEFKKGEVFIAEALSEDGETLWGAAADTLEELLEGMMDEHRVRITKETAELGLKEWAREQRKPSPEKVWKEFQMKGPGGNPAETDAAPETWAQSFRRWWRSLAYGINDNGPSDQ